MDKLDKLIELAKKKVPVQVSIELSQATRDELLDLINDATSKERFHEIVTALVYRGGNEVSSG
jgi:hypothetical protein